MKYIKYAVALVILSSSAFASVYDLDQISDKIAEHMSIEFNSLNGIDPELLTPSQYQKLADDDTIDLFDKDAIKKALEDLEVVEKAEKERIEREKIEKANAAELLDLAEKAKKAKEDAASAMSKVGENSATEPKKPGENNSSLEFAKKLTKADQDAAANKKTDQDAAANKKADQDVLDVSAKKNAEDAAKKRAGQDTIDVDVSSNKKADAASIKVALKNIAKFSDLSKESFEALKLNTEQIKALKTANVTKETTDAEINKILKDNAGSSDDGKPPVNISGSISSGDVSSNEEYGGLVYNYWFIGISSVLVLLAIGGGAYMMTRKTEEINF